MHGQGMGFQLDLAAWRNQATALRACATELHHQGQPVCFSAALDSGPVDTSKGAATIVSAFYMKPCPYSLRGSSRVASPGAKLAQEAALMLWLCQYQGR